MRRQCHVFTGGMQPVNWNKRRREWNHLKELDFPKLGQRPTVDLLIGLDYSELHYSHRDIQGEEGEPTARLTSLGWTCVGPVLPSSKINGQVSYCYHVDGGSLEASPLKQEVERFWTLEDIATDSANAFNPDEREAMASVNESFKFVAGRYQVGMPWKRNIREQLPENYAMALKRLTNTEKRLLRNATVAAAYQDTIKKYLDKGYIRKVLPTEVQPSATWYLPHFAIVRPDKTTTKTRIVFDASATCQGISLNDVIHTGPKLQRSLFAVLMRFRHHPIALVCDIAEMYLQISVVERDRAFLRFLWRDMDVSAPAEEYEFQRVVFGVNASPFVAQFVTQEHARRNAKQYPRASNSVLSSTYMDDTMDSVPTVEEAIDLYQQLVKLWNGAGMAATQMGVELC